MTKALLRPIMLAIVLALGVMPAQAQRPDPHGGGSTVEQSTATAVATPAGAGCDLVVSYTHDLYTAIDNSGAFATYFTSDVDFGDVSASEAEAVIKDGDALIETLKGLDVPPVFAEAHEGILTFLQFTIDTARFYGLDTSVVPDIAGEDQAFDQIEAGELALAQACPDEIQQVGGYILLNPSQDEEDPVDPGSPGN